MDDIVAIKVRDAKAQKHYFLTWGRIFDRVDPQAPRIGCREARFEVWDQEIYDRIYLCQPSGSISRQSFLRSIAPHFPRENSFWRGRLRYLACKDEEADAVWSTAFLLWSLPESCIDKILASPGFKAVTCFNAKKWLW